MDQTTEQVVQPEVTQTTTTLTAEQPKTELPHPNSIFSQNHSGPNELS